MRSVKEYLANDLGNLMKPLDKPPRIPRPVEQRCELRKFIPNPLKLGYFRDNYNQKPTEENNLSMEKKPDGPRSMDKLARIVYENKENIENCNDILLNQFLEGEQAKMKSSQKNFKEINKSLHSGKETEFRLRNRSYSNSNNNQIDYSFQEKKAQKAESPPAIKINNPSNSKENSAVKYIAKQGLKPLAPLQ